MMPMWVGIMVASALLPVAARAVGSALPWIAESVAWYANHLSSFYGDPYVLFDAFGLFGVMMAGAYFGLYYGARRTTRKRARWIVAVLVLTISATIFVTTVVQDAVSILSYGETPKLAAAAIRSVGVAVAGAVLGANIGRLRGADNPPKWGIYVKESALLSAIFVLAWAAAYVQGALDDSPDGVNALLGHTAPLTGSAVVGAVLGVHYGSYRPRCGDRPQFGKVVAVLLAAAIVVSIIIDKTMPEHPDIIWMLVLAFSSVGMGMIGTVLGMHVSARSGSGTAFHN